MAWTNLTFAYGSILTSAKMTQLDDNLDALAAGSSGAPKIQAAALEQTNGLEAVTQPTIRASAVGTNEIANLAVTNGKIQNTTIDFADKVALDGGVNSYNINPYTTQVIPKGLYNFAGNSAIWRVQIYQNTKGWVTTNAGTDVQNFNIMSDGANVRIFNNSAITQTIYYKKLL